MDLFLWFKAPLFFFSVLSKIMQNVVTFCVVFVAAFYYLYNLVRRNIGMDAPRLCSHHGVMVNACHRWQS